MKRAITTCAVLLLLASCASATPGGELEVGHHHEGGPHHDFSDAEAWARRFEGEGRDAWQRPDSVVRALLDRDDRVVLDIGSATGYFPVRFARASPKGRVFGIDVEPAMVRYLGDRAAREGLTNLTSLVARPDDAGIASLPVKPDLVFVCNTYHHIGDRVRYFSKARAELGPGARLAIVDFRKTSSMGPPAKHKLAVERVVAELTKAGWQLEIRHEFLPEQYFLVFGLPK